MYKLSLNNIEAITADVEREKISFSHLKFDLIDHICCDVELLMQQGLAFKEAYQSIRKQFSEEGLISLKGAISFKLW